MSAAALGQELTLHNFTLLNLIIIFSIRRFTIIHNCSVYKNCYACFYFQNNITDSSLFFFLILNEKTLKMHFYLVKANII